MIGWIHMRPQGITNTSNTDRKITTTLYSTQRKHRTVWNWSISPVHRLDLSHVLRHGGRNSHSSSLLECCGIEGHSISPMPRQFRSHTLQRLLHIHPLTHQSNARTLEPPPLLLQQLFQLLKLSHLELQL